VIVVNVQVLPSYGLPCCFWIWISGAAESILAKAEATARGIKMVSESFKTEGAVEVWHSVEKNMEQLILELWILTFEDASVGCKSEDCWAVHPGFCSPGQTSESESHITCYCVACLDTWY
jgi:hypothetical protein